MKITKARLKQIIQEELQTLSEQTTAASTARKRAASYTGGSGETIDQEMARRKKQGDLRQVDPDTGKIVYQTTDTAMAAQDATSGYGMPGQSSFDPESEYNKQRDADVAAQVASGGIEFDDSIRPGGDTDSTVTSSTVVDDILSGKPEGVEGAFGDADGKEKPAKPARVARKGTGATRREINKMWKDGKIDKATWRKARRALANKGEAAARAALGGASAPEQQRDVAKKRQRKAALGGEGGYADAAEKAQTASKTAKAKLGPPTGNIERDFLKLRKRGLKVSETSEGTQQAYQELVNTYLDQGEESRDARLKARKALISRLSKQVTKRSNQRRLAKQYFDRFKEQGLDNSEAVQLANAALSGTENPRSAPALRRSRGVSRALAGGGTGRPGSMEESIEKLTNLIAEEFKATLSENEAPIELARTLQQAGLQGLPLPAAQAVIAAQERSPAAADKILALAMKLAKDGVHSKDLIDGLKQMKARPQVAKKPAEQSQAAKKSEAPQDIRKKRDQARKRRKTYPRRRAAGGKGIPAGGK